MIIKDNLLSCHTTWLFSSKRRPSLMKQNLKPKCVKIGLKLANATTEKSVNLHMESRSYMKNQFQIKIDINQKNATVSIHRCSAHMDNDAFSFTITEIVMR